jgi:hypothetical protein
MPVRSLTGAPFFGEQVGGRRLRSREGSENVREAAKELPHLAGCDAHALGLQEERFLKHRFAYIQEHHFEEKTLYYLATASAVNARAGGAVTCEKVLEANGADTWSCFSSEVSARAKVVGKRLPRSGASVCKSAAHVRAPTMPSSSPCSRWKRLTAASVSAPPVHASCGSSPITTRATSTKAPLILSTALPRASLAASVPGLSFASCLRITSASTSG